MLRADRPGSVDEGRPLLERIAMAAPPAILPAPVTVPAASNFERQAQRRAFERLPDDEPEYETVWNGGEGLSSYAQRSTQ